MGFSEKCCSCFEGFLVLLTLASPILVTGSLELALRNSHEDRFDQSISKALAGIDTRTGEINYQVRIFVTVMLVINAIFMHMITISRNLQLEILLRMQKHYTRCWLSMNMLSTLFGILFAIFFVGLAVVHIDTQPKIHKIMAISAFAFLMLWMITHTLVTMRSLSSEAKCGGGGCCQFISLSVIMLVWTIFVTGCLVIFGIAYLQNKEEDNYKYEWAAIYAAVWYAPIIGFLFTQNGVGDELQEFFFRCSRRRVEQRCEAIEHMPDYVVSV